MYVYVEENLSLPESLPKQIHHKCSTTPLPIPSRLVDTVLGTAPINSPPVPLQDQGDTDPLGKIQLSECVVTRSEHHSQNFVLALRCPDRDNFMVQDPCQQN